MQDNQCNCQSAITVYDGIISGVVGDETDTIVHDFCPAIY